MIIILILSLILVFYVGFINKNLRKEFWNEIRNNWYVLGNKVYYRDTSSSAKERDDDVFFVPVRFDDDVQEFEEEDEEGKTEMFNSNAVYDLHGRCIANGQSVIDGSWRNSVTPGIYIYRGKKLYIK